MIYIVGVIAIIVAGTVITLVLQQESGKGWVASIGAVIALVAWTIFMMATVVSSGHVAIASWFGSVQTTVIPEGFRFVNPMTSLSYFSTRRETVDFANDKAKGNNHNPVNGPAVLALSSDRNPLTVEVSFPYSINAPMAWKLFQRVAATDDALEAKLMETNARKITGEVFARHPWAESTLTKRPEIEQELQDHFSDAVVADLMVYGFSAPEAKAAITIGKPQVREVKPDDKVLNAIAERLASEEHLKRQQILTDIAKQEADRRANEGLGISKLFAELPKDFKPEQIQAVLGAIADKERADALMKAVELGRVQIIAVPSTGSVALPVGK